MPSTRRRVLLTAIAVCAACAWGSDPNALRVLQVEHAPAPFPHAARIEVVVLGPGDHEHTSNGEVARGSTTRALCASLCRSLARAGCLATLDDLDEDPMRQRINLPSGWQLLSARTVAIGDKPAPELVLTLGVARSR